MVFGIDTYTFHTGSFVLFLVVIIELVTVTVAFLNMFLSVCLICFRAFLQYTLVSTQTHGSAHIGDRFLLFHDINHVVRSLLIHFA